MIMIFVIMLINLIILDLQTAIPGACSQWKKVYIRHTTRDFGGYGQIWVIMR